MTSDTAKRNTSGSGDPAVQHWRPQEGTATTPAATGGAAVEVGGRKDGTEPTRFGDWEKAGRCIDF